MRARSRLARAGGGLLGAVVAAGGLLAGCASAGGLASAAPSGGEYAAFVASEATDQVARVVFDGRTARVDETWTVGTNPVENEGPHGIALSPDGQFAYVSMAHGTPFGSLWKVSTRTGQPVEQVTLGLFPATVDVTPNGEYAFISNFNLHGDHVPSSVSKVHLPTMTEVARTETCVMPHGSRVNPQGTKQYSACMMDQVVVEIDVATGTVSRRFSVAPGMEGAAHAGMHHAAPAGGKVCSPTWAHPGADGSRVYVACNKANEVLEIDVERWEVVRRFPTGEAPYNLATTPDGRYLLVTLKNRTAPATEVIELATGRSVARVPSSTVLPHGLAVTADSRFAFVSVEGVRAEPGKVDVIHLGTLQRVASVDVGQQAGGIAVAGSAN